MRRAADRARRRCATGATAVTRKPRRGARARAAGAASPARPRPKRKLPPTTTAAAPRRRRSTSRANASALEGRDRGREGQHRERVDAERSQDLRLLLEGHAAARGRCPGASTRAGCGSKVSTTAAAAGSLRCRDGSATSACVTAVHAVEVADGGGARPRPARGCQRLQAISIIARRDRLAALGRRRVRSIRRGADRPARVVDRASAGSRRWVSA